MNPLFGMLGGGNQQNALIQKFQQFRQSFQGDPKAEVMRLVHGNNRAHGLQYIKIYTEEKSWRITECLLPITRQ